MMATDLKERLRIIVDRKDELKAQKAKLEAKIELIEKEIAEVTDELEVTFETSDLKDLAKIKQNLIIEAEALLASDESEDDGED